MILGDFYAEYNLQNIERPWQ